MNQFVRTHTELQVFGTSDFGLKLLGNMDAHLRRCPVEKAKTWTSYGQDMSRIIGQPSILGSGKT